MRTPFKIGVGFIGIFILLMIVVGAFSSGGGSGQSNSNAHAVAKAKPTTQWALVVRQSSCQETPSTAYVNCSIGVRNGGDAPGLPTVYASYRYSDSGESIDESDNGASRTSDPIPAHQLGWVYFSHSYNAQQHDVLQVAVTLDENADRWPYVRVADPTDMNWPNG
jgi:hypothetical protein